MSEPGADEVFDWIELNDLEGKGLSWVDCILLATAARNSVSIWTRERALEQAARRLKLAHGKS